MKILEEAIIYATQLHQGRVRKMSGTPYILHPLEVAQILSTMTEDEDVITAGVLHDIVEDTEGTIEELEEKFGKRVAELVASETENKYPSEDPTATWKRRKEEMLLVLGNSKDIGVKMLWLADKLSNIRSLVRNYSEHGDEVWKAFHQSDPQQHCWYYRTVAEYVEYDLNRTGAYKEFINHINFIWPGTFASEKTRYKKYKEVSVEGCALIGRGAKGNVYRYDDELVIKVYHEGITYKDVEREIAVSRKAFVLGLPTAISFGIVAVGKGYGAMFELIGSSTVSECIAKNPSQVEYYAKLMAALAHQIHDSEVGEDCFRSTAPTLMTWVTEGIAEVDGALAERVLPLVRELPETKKLTHGDFHTGNVMLQKGEPIMIDLDRLAFGHPIVDLCGLYMAYIAFGEKDPSVVENYMGFSYETAKLFFRRFLEYYIDTTEEERLRSVTEQAALLCYVRMIWRIRRKGFVTKQEEEEIRGLVEKIRNLIDRVDSFLITG